MTVRLFYQKYMNFYNVKISRAFDILLAKNISSKISNENHSLEKKLHFNKLVKVQLEKRKKLKVL